VRHVVGGAGTIGWVALKAVLLYVTAVLGFRLSERRTLAEMSPFDFVAAVAVGAIVGRVPNASTTSYIEGAATLVTLLLCHRVITRLRYFTPVHELLDRPPRLLVCDGEVLHRQLKRSGLTDADLYGLLRRHGIADLADVQYVVFESRGQISIIRKSDRDVTRSGLLTEIEGLRDRP
jgi:uncharacterized membrane protein YcaP (DUF421 family)